MTLILRLWLTFTKYLWHSSWGCGRHSSVIYDTRPEIVVDTHQLFMTLFLGLWLTLTNYLWQSSWGCGWHSSTIYDTHPEVVVITHQLFMTLILGWRCPWPLLISFRKQFVILFFKFPRFPRLSQHLIQLINAKASFSPNVSLKNLWRRRSFCIDNLKHILTESKRNKRNDKRFNNRGFSLFFLMCIFLNHLWLIPYILKWQNCKIFTKLVP